MVGFFILYTLLIMKDRLLFLLKSYLLIVFVFILQKPIFMISNSVGAETPAFSDYFAVIWNGLGLDLTTAAYLIALPVLVIILSIFVSRINYRKLFKVYFIAIAIICGIIFISDNSLYEFWQFKLDATVFFYLRSPEQAFASVSVWFMILRLIEIAAYSFVVSWLLLKFIPKDFKPVDKKVKAVLWFPFILALLFVIIRGGLGRSTANVGKAYFSNDQFLNHSAVNPAFSLFYSMGKAEDFSDDFQFFEDSERKEIFDDLYKAVDDKEVAQDSILCKTEPDILLIIMEGFGANFISSLNGLPDVTPNFNKLASEGVFFTNCYGNSFRTDRGMVCAMSGHLSYPTTSIMKMPSKSRTLPSIAGSLQKSGYKTSFLYGGDINFTNMKSYLLGSGYQEIVSDVDFSMAERSSNAWGVTDHITFEYIYDKIVNKNEDEKRFYTFLTLSSHEPFEVPYSRLTEKVPNSMAYTDDCLGKFVDKLKKTKAWDNLLIICVADHGIYYPMEGPRSNPSFFRIPLLLAGGAVKEAKKYDYLVNQSDLAATLLAQLGIDHTDFKFSRNVLTDKYREYPFANYTFINGFAYTDSTGISVYDNNGNIVIYNEDIMPGGQEQRVKKGKVILQTAYDDLGSR